MFRTVCLLVLLLGPSLIRGVEPEKYPVFTTEEQMLAVTREDQTKAIETKMVKRQVLLSEVINVMTTYRKVTRRQYMIFHHSWEVRGTISLTDGKTYKWSIEPGYAATVESPTGETIYLLHPRLPLAR